MNTPSVPDRGDAPTDERLEVNLVEICRLMLRLRRLGGTSSEGQGDLFPPDPELTGHYYVG